MGTRNLTIVKSKGKTKVAQYGQWDGYPTGQGKTIVEFLKSKKRIENLKNNLKNCRFFEIEGRDKEFIEEYDRNAPTWSNEPDKRTEEQISWFNKYITRDLGAKILYSISEAKKDEEILLRNEEDFKKDNLSCEYWYEVDLDKETVRMNGGKKFKFKEWTHKLMEILENN